MLNNKVFCNEMQVGVGVWQEVDILTTSHHKMCSARGTGPKDRRRAALAARTVSKRGFFRLRGLQSASL